MLGNRITLDIETGHAPEEAIAAMVADVTAPANYKDPEKIVEYLADAKRKAAERSALSLQARVLCVAARRGDGRAVIFNGMDAEEPQIPGWLVYGCGSERVMLEALRAWLAEHADGETVLCGHNIAGFDLPILRLAMLRHRLALPAVLAPRDPRDEESRNQPLLDTMKVGATYYSTNRDWPSVASLCAALGVHSPKAPGISGADVPRLAAEGGHTEDILAYCCLDVLAEEQLALLLTGEHAELR